VGMSREGSYRHRLSPQSKDLSKKWISRHLCACLQGGQMEELSSKEDNGERGAKTR